MQNAQESNWLKQYQKDIFSQNGEDGVVEAIMSILPQKNKWAVEFGAWNGKYLSNTYNLVHNHGYACVLIEGDAKRFNDLRGLRKEHDSVVVINSYVSSSGENTLDNILGKTEIPMDFDFLSIDIDGNDFHVWQSLENYRPKIICIEF